MMHFKTYFRLALSFVLFSALWACSSAPKAPTAAPAKAKDVLVVDGGGSNKLPAANSGRGGYYMDDGPAEAIPPDLEKTPDPVPVVEPFSRTGNKTYQVFGKTYTPINDTTTPFKQRGIASWYGKKFHGKRTSSGELYDMFKITGAHPILPIPSYARVTNLSNGKQIIVRINDRGPFHSNRIMDLSYTAALKLGYLGKGSGEIELERLLPDEIARMAENRKGGIVQTEQASEESLQDARRAVEREQLARGSLSKTKSVDQVSLETRALDSATTAANTATPAKANSERSGLFYLQFAAFGIRANAEASREQMQKKIGEQFSSLSIPLEITEQGNLYRLQAGPFANRLEAQTILEKIASTVGKAIVVQR
ncbi:septal ring lytic transglycosylase RlpA family protein [Undibacterium cyanobacteriorum]|uniref:Endolytic peptidoglycan transglycosylase RlpA n=1 Tax=Undibacterium cyanobacteriorum TaxID=3073561 RepID=A0ABY9RIP9_9BURK|nr:septal ring lytic transglycosylase RlpA family protein [Undibacterium sp. 20NA77.5]WMW81096.1 septal ring lytic transglycosylase RlpA family protein [Undibacterium sp. 20NA77.5]